MQRKKCSRCGVTKSISQFHKQKSGRYGRVGRCKFCIKKVHFINKESIKVQQAKYRNEHRNARNKQRREIYNRNRSTELEKMREYQKTDEYKAALKKYRDNNKEKVLAATREWANKNKQYVSETQSNWLKSEKGKNHKRLLNQKRRALKKSTHVPYTQDELDQLFSLFDNSCAYCFDKSDLTIDHIVAIINGGVDSIQNIVPACKRCNSSKGIKDMEIWYSKQQFFNIKSLDGIKLASCRPH